MPEFGSFVGWTKPTGKGTLKLFWVDQEHGNVIVDSGTEPPEDE
jgi:hypothetical protein